MGCFFACQKINALVLIFLYAGRGAKCPGLNLIGGMGLSTPPPNVLIKNVASGASKK
jgi:hypothetical protein